jgi:hypothetical protein
MSHERRGVESMDRLYEDANGRRVDVYESLKIWGLFPYYKS